MADPVRKYRSAEEGAMRAIVAQHLRARWPFARVIHEFPLRYSRSSIDMAAITETDIIGVEIKSSRDVIDRLERQLRGFVPICTKIIVALAPKWNEKLPSLEKPGRRGGTIYESQLTEAQAVIARVQETSIETWTCCHETETMKNTNGGWGSQKLPWPARMLDILHCVELELILSGGIVPHKPRAHELLVRLVHDRLTGPQIIKAVCRALRTRPGFAAESDPPVPGTRVTTSWADPVPRAEPLIQEAASHA